MPFWSPNRYTYKRFKGKVVYEPEKSWWDKIKRYACCVRKRKPILRWNAGMEAPKDEEKKVVDSDEEGKEEETDPAKKGKRKKKKKRGKKYLKHDSAVIMQALIRGFLGKCRAKARWSAAIKNAEDFWAKSGEEQALAIELKRIEKVTRAKFAFTYALDLVDMSAKGIIQWHAATDLQRVWRGYNFRRKFKRPVKKRLRKPRLKLRYGIDVYRRNWARTGFMPAAGYWPIGKQDKPQTGVNYEYKYDVWENVDNAPKGPDYGFKTKKIFLRGNMVEEHATRKIGISAGDRIGNPATIDRDTDWFGIPTELVSKTFDDEVRHANRSKMEKLLTYTTPYLTPIFNTNYERSKNPYSHFNTSDISADNLAMMMKDVGWSVELMKFQKMIETEAKKSLENMWASLRSRSLFSDHEDTWSNLQKNLILSSSSASISDLIQKSGAEIPDKFFVEAAVNLIKSRKDLINTINAENAKKELDRSMMKSRSRGGSPSRSRSGSPDSKSTASLDGSLNQSPPLRLAQKASVPIMETMTDFRDPQELLQNFKSLRNDQPLRGSYKPVSNVSQSELATVRTMIYSNDPEKSSFPNKVPGTLPTGNKLMNEIDQIKEEDTKLLDKTSYRAPNPMIQYSMDPKMKPPPLKEYDPYAKYRRYSTLSTFKDANKLALEGAKGDVTKFKNTSWGKLKSRAQELTAPEANTNEFGDSKVYTDVDAETWSRALFKPKVVVRSRAKVWATKPRCNFMLRYTWLPKRYVDHSIKHIYSNRIKGMEDIDRYATRIQDSSFVTTEEPQNSNMSILTAQSSLGVDVSMSTTLQPRPVSPVAVAVAKPKPKPSTRTSSPTNSTRPRPPSSPSASAMRPRPPSPIYKERLTPHKDSSKISLSRAGTSPGKQDNSGASPPKQRSENLEFYKERLTDGGTNQSQKVKSRLFSQSSLNEEIDEGDDVSASSTKFFYLRKSNLLSDGDSLMKKYGSSAALTTIGMQSQSDDDDAEVLGNNSPNGQELVDLKQTLSKGLRAIDRFGSTKDSLDTRGKEKIERQKNLARQSDIIRAEVYSRKFPKEKVVVREDSPERGGGSPIPRSFSIKASTLGRGLDGLNTFSESYGGNATIISNGKIQQFGNSTNNSNSFLSQSSGTAESPDMSDYKGSYVVDRADKSYLFRQSDNTKSPNRPGAKTLLDTMKEFDQNRVDEHGLHSYPYH